jgi:hypothetical protein
MIVTTKPEHEVAYQDLADLVGKHKDKLSGLEMLAVAANMLGKLIALQDQRTVTPEMAMKIVVENVELGNQQIINGLKLESKGSA